MQSRTGPTPQAALVGRKPFTLIEPSAGGSDELHGPPTPEIGADEGGVEAEHVAYGLERERLDSVGAREPARGVVQAALAPSVGRSKASLENREPQSELGSAFVSNGSRRRKDAFGDRTPTRCGLRSAANGRGFHRA